MAKQFTDKQALLAAMIIVNEQITGDSKVVYDSYVNNHSELEGSDIPLACTHEEFKEMERTMQHVLGDYSPNVIETIANAIIEEMKEHGYEFVNKGS